MEVSTIKSYLSGAQYSTYSEIKEMIKAGDDKNYDYVHQRFGSLHDLINDQGATFLHYSSHNNDIAMTQWLVDYGLDVDAQTKDGETPLMIAITYNRDEIVSILLKANAKIVIVDYSGQTLVEKLSIRFIDLPFNYSSIPKEIMMKLIDKCETEDEAAAKLFNVQVPFHFAVCLQNSVIIKYYLDQGVDVNLRKSCEEVTALHMAIHYQDWKSVKLLLKYGANINAKDWDDYAPIMYMRESKRSKSEKLEILTDLLDRGAELTTFTKNCSDSGRMQIHSVFCYCSKEAVQLVLQTNIDLLTRDERGQTLLHYLAGNKNPGVFELLQNQIIDLNLTDKFGYTLLHTAVTNNQCNTAQMLLDRGIDIDVQTEYGRTPLMQTMTNYRKNNKGIECIELLLQHGANPQISKIKNLTFVDFGQKLARSDYIQPVLAHIAMLEATEMIIEKEIRASIDSVNQMKNSFNNYKQQLDQFKNITIYGSVTMFQLLTMSEKQLLIHLQDEQLTSKLGKGDYKNSQGAYYRKLRLRITCAYRKVQLKQRAVEALYKIMQLPYNTHPTITDEMCSYLSKQDLVLLGLI